MNKKVFAFVVFAMAFVSAIFSADITFVDYKLEGDVLMKVSDLNPSKFAWRNVLYSENEIEEGSKQEFILKTENIKKGYTGISLFQDGGKSVAVNTNGKEQKIIPGQVFTKEGGIIWLGFTAPDKNKYRLPSNIQFKQENTQNLAVVVNESENDFEKNIKLENPYDENSEEDSSKEVSETEANDSEKIEYPLYRDSTYIPVSDDPVGYHVTAGRQNVERGTNVQTVIKNLPAFTKPQILYMDNLEVLVYIAPDLTLKTNDNCFTLFYCYRRANRDEDFSQPKRVVENPKVNGKLTNMIDFSGSVANVNGKKKLVLCWSQCAIQKEEGVTDEELLRKTSVYWATWGENDPKWTTTETVTSLKGVIQCNLELQNTSQGLCLKTFEIGAENEDGTIPTNNVYYLLSKKGVWSECKADTFKNLAAQKENQFDDRNYTVPSDFEYICDKSGTVQGAFWSENNKLIGKTYTKNPETKKMIWTQGASVLYQNGNSPVLYPKGFVRDNGEWIVTYLLQTENGNNICVSKIIVEPCINTLSLVANPQDMMKPGLPVRFSVILENQGLGIAEGLDVIIKNELNTEAGKISHKNVILPGEKYELAGIYEALRGKDGVVPVEDVRAEVKFSKMKMNSQYASYEGRYTLGVPKFHIGDIFVTTKGKSQKVTYTLGTSNGPKIKAMNAEVLINEHYNSSEYEDKQRTILVDNDFSSDLYFTQTYEYETSDADVSEFDFDILLHYLPAKCKIPGWDSEDVEKATCFGRSVSVKNPLYNKDSFTSVITETSFVKKTKIMTVEFMISNNWPEAIDKEFYLTLVNANTGVGEQVITVPVQLEMLQNKKGIVSFEPAMSDLATDYIVQINTESELSPEPWGEKTSSDSVNDFSFDEVEDVEEVEE